MSQEQVQSTGKIIKLSDILALMAEGKTRKEINALYGETDAAMKIKVWSHEKLKNKKSAKVVNITLEDDTDSSEEVAREVETIPVAPAIEETEQVADEPSQDVTEAQEQAPVTEAPATQGGTW